MRLQINKTKIRRLYFHLSHTYLTFNNLVIGAALLIGLSWVWGSISVMERNFALQKQIDGLQQQKQLGALQLDLLKYQQNYYKTDEYKALAVRQTLGLGDPGEKLLILPPNSQTALSADNPDSLAAQTKTKVAVAPPSNLQQWMTFLFGGASKSLNSGS